MGPELVDLDEMVIVGLAENGPDISALWRRFEESEHLVRNEAEGVGYELHSYPEGEHEWSDVTVMVGVQVTRAEDVPEGMVVKVLPPAQYALFTHRLADGGYEGANERMDSWLAAGPYRLHPHMSIQRFDERFRGGSHPDSEIDFLLPVVPKE